MGQVQSQIIWLSVFEKKQAVTMSEGTLSMSKAQSCLTNMLEKLNGKSERYSRKLEKNRKKASLLLYFLMKWIRYSDPVAWAFHQTWNQLLSLLFWLKLTGLKGYGTS